MHTHNLPFDIQRASAEIQKRYLDMVASGVTPRAAEMFALQSPPGVRGTDRGLMAGRSNNEQFDSMPPDHARGIIEMARGAGISVTGKYYYAGLADKRGPADPAAWVDSVHDVKRVAAERNLTISGMVEHKGIAVDRPKSKPMSARLVREMMRAEKRRKPTMKKGELREYVMHKYGRKPKP